MQSAFQRDLGNFVLIQRTTYKSGRKGGGGGLITSSQTTILRFTSRKTNIYEFKVFKNRGRTKCQQRFICPIL